MNGSGYNLSVENCYVLVERSRNYTVTLDEQPAALQELLAACEQANTRNVLVLGPDTKIDLSTFDILELGGEIANSRLKIAVVEKHDASIEDVGFLENVAWNRGGLIQFFDSKKAAENWLCAS